MECIPANQCGNNFCFYFHFLLIEYFIQNIVGTKLGHGRNYFCCIFLTNSMHFYSELNPSKQPFYLTLTTLWNLKCKLFVSLFNCVWFTNDIHAFTHFPKCTIFLSVLAVSLKFPPKYRPPTHLSNPLDSPNCMRGLCKIQKRYHRDLSWS